MRFFYYNVKYRIRKSRRVKEVLNKVIRKNGFIPGDLNYIITNNRIIKELNYRYLRHNYATDVISFKFDKGKKINGEVYISIEKVRANAKKYKVSVRNELMRVLIHGTLHLCNFTDYNIEEKLNMKKEEDYWLNSMND